MGNVGRCVNLWLSWLEELLLLLEMYLILLLSNSSFLGSKDKVTIPTSNFPRLSASDSQSSPASPSSVYLSTSEMSPSSPKITTANDFLGPGGGTLGQEHVRQPNRARGQQHSHQPHQSSTSPSSHTRKTSKGDSKAASPRKPPEDWSELSERSPSPRKTEQGYGGSLEDMNKKAPGQRNHHSSSPRKTSKKESDSTGPSRNAVEPQSPRRPAGQQPSTAHREGKDRRFKEEDAAYWSERGATESVDKSPGTTERHKRNKRADQDGAKAQTHKEKAGSDVDSSTPSRRGGKDGAYHGSTEEVNRKDPRSSGSSIQDPSCNGTTTSKKAPITPGPWKVPSSARIQSQWETSYADIWKALTDIQDEHQHFP